MKAKHLGEANDDDVPEDELALAAALQEMHARGLTLSYGAEFRTARGAIIYAGDMHNLDYVKQHVGKCCAFGALKLAGIVPMLAHVNVLPRTPYQDAWIGNDSSTTLPWDHYDIGGDRGQSLGYAFRCAMRSDG